MKNHRQISFLTVLWVLMGLGLAGLSCGGEGGCPPGQVPSNIKFGATPQEGCVFTCFGNADCPSGEFCPESVFTLESTCEACSPTNFPSGSSFECDSNEDCSPGQTCLGCQCDGTPTDGCPPVDVTPGTVPIGEACDQNEDCAEGVPCIDCVCI